MCFDTYVNMYVPPDGLDDASIAGSVNSSPFDVYPETRGEIKTVCLPDGIFLETSIAIVCRSTPLGPQS
jgi:hypothetical protein